MKIRYQKGIIVAILAVLLTAPFLPALAQTNLTSVPVINLKDPIEEIARSAFDTAVNKLLDNPDYFCEDQSYKTAADPQERITVLGITVEACKKLLDAIDRLPI